MRISDWSSDVCSSDLLRHRHVGARVAVERHQLVERPVADHHAGGMRRGVAVEPFQAQRDGEQAVDRLVLQARLLELRLAVDGLLQADRVGRRSEEHTSALQSLMRISYAVLCLKKKIIPNKT